MSDNFFITELPAADNAVITSLAKRIWPVAFAEILSPEQIEYMLRLFYSADSLTEQIENKGHRFFTISSAAAEPSGFVSIENNYGGEPITKVHKIYLLPETQGKGLGKLLMNHAENIARENKAEFLTLNVNRYNNARYFYEKLGFSVVKEETIEIGNGYLMEDYVMEKELK